MIREAKFRTNPFAQGEVERRLEITIKSRLIHQENISNEDTLQEIDRMLIASIDKHLYGHLKEVVRKEIFSIRSIIAHQHHLELLDKIDDHVNNIYCELNKL